ncbi:MAG: hypothetical protein HC921_12880 [Synechococcaceae cyanobacterium SM2_3_1]|nr:hypothetical protein [Synechococcaceae cyanobacterium SM2_3_1]
MTNQTYILVVGSTLINQPPSITSVPIFLASVGDPYTYQVEATDPDVGDILTYDLLQGPTGMGINTQSGLVEWNTPVAGSYAVVVSATDLGGFGASQGYTLTVWINQAPVIRSTPNTEAIPGSVYLYDLQATDPNGDALTYALDPDSLAIGLTIDERGRIRWEPSLSDVGSYPVTVTVTDASGVSQDQAFNLNVAADMTDPVVDLDFVGELLLIGGQLSLPLGGSVGLAIAATDNQGISNLELRVDGEIVPLDVNNTSPYTPESTGLKTISLTATDTSGNTTTISRTLSVFDPTDADAPQIILDPLPEQITAPINVTGTVTDANLVSYVIEVQAFGSDEPYREVFRGTDPVVDGVIGQLDPSVLPNDSYRVRVRATDATGKESRLEDQTSISGELKLGNFQLSFVDLEIPVSGIPITLVRTYDSLNANTTDELGYGWRLEFKDADVRVNLPRDPVFEELGYRSVGFRPETKVFVTLPGGTRETFFFDPTIIIWSLFLPGSQGESFLSSLPT